MPASTTTPKNGAAIGSAAAAATEFDLETVYVSFVKYAQDNQPHAAKLTDVIDAITDSRFAPRVAEVRRLYTSAMAKALAEGKTREEAVVVGKKAAKEIKEQLNGILFSGVFLGGRTADDLKQHSGILCLDLDALGERLPELRKQLQADPHWLWDFISPSGDGFKVLVPIPPDARRHLASFLTVEKYFKEHFGVEVDKACKDVNRLCFASDDPDGIEPNAQAIPFEPDPAILEELRAKTKPKSSGDHNKGNQPKRQPKTKPAEEKDGEKEKVSVGYLKVRRALTFIDPAGLEYPDWLQIGMALHDWSGGSDYGMELWDEWSAQDKSRYDSAVIEEKWRTFSEGDGVTILTVFKLARDGGWDGYERPGVFLPTKRATDFCRQVYQIIAPTHTLFLADRVVVTVEKNAAGQPEIVDVKPSKGIRIFEEQIQFLIQKAGENGELKTVPVELPEKRAKLLLEGAMPGELPILRGVLNFSPLVVVGDRLEIAPPGYVESSGRYNASAGPVPFIPVEQAVKKYKDLFSDWDFATRGDRARALAYPIGVAMKLSGLISGEVPMDFGTADDSGAGKTWRQKLTALFFNDECVQLVQREQGYGNTWDSFQAACMAGRAFCQLDNFDSFQSREMEAFLTGNAVMMRSAYRKNRIVNPGDVVVSMTSNGLASSQDLASRCWFIDQREHPENYSWKVYPEGTVLDHVRRHQAHDLGCIYAIIREWWDLGKKRTDEQGHRFKDFTQVCDWISQHILGETAVMEGHKDKSEHYSDTGRVLFTRLWVALRKQGKLNVPYQAGQLGTIAVRKSLHIPGMKTSTPRDENSIAKLIGAVAAGLFEDEPRLDLGQGRLVQRLKKFIIQPNDEDDNNPEMAWIRSRNQRNNDAYQYIFKQKGSEESCEAEAEVKDEVTLFRDALLRRFGGAPIDCISTTEDIARFFKNTSPDSAGSWMGKLQGRWPDKFQKLPQDGDGKRRWQIKWK